MVQYFNFVAWATWLIQRWSSTLLRGAWMCNMRGNVSALWSSADSLQWVNLPDGKGKPSNEQQTTSSVLIKLMFKWIWDTKSATRNPIYNNLRLLSGKLGQPSEAHFHFIICTSNYIFTFSLLQSFMQLCLSLINSVEVLMLCRWHSHQHGTH